VKDPLLRFAEVPWNDIATGAREKAFRYDNQTVRLLELSAGFEDDWCRREHIGYVVDGSFELHFADRTVTFHEGDGFVIAGGEATRHRTVVGEDPVTLFLIDPR